VRITSHASEQYRTNAAAATSRGEEAVTPVQAQAQTLATVTTTAFGFRLGGFGLDYESSSTVLNPSLSFEARRSRQQAAAFSAQAEVTSLRAQVGVEGADYRTLPVTAEASVGTPSLARVKSALAAYARCAQEPLLPPGTMLAAVV